jgi:hypothetical protein
MHISNTSAPSSTLKQEKYDVVGRAVAPSGGPFHTEISSEYMLSRLKHLENQGQCAPRLFLSLQQLQIAENGASGDRAGAESKVAPSAACDKTVVSTTNTVC